MEFKFRSVDDRPPPFRPPPPPPPPLAIFSAFSEPPLPSPMPGHSFPPVSNFAPSRFSNTPSGFPRGGGGDFRPNPSPMRNSNNVGDVVMRNLEKERIREEMILGEIARRRELEAEVRQEIMFLERQMATRRAAVPEGFSLGDRFATTRCNNRPPLPVHPFDDRLDSMRCGTSLRPPLGCSSIDERSGIPLAPPQEDVAAKFKASPGPNKDKLIVLARPDPNLCGTKRKAVGPPTVDPNELHPFGLKKKPREEWSCALCQVSATSERVLNDHLQGKKHKSKEAKLKNQNAGKHPSTSIPNKAGGSTANSELEAEVEGKLLVKNKTGNVSNKKKNRKKDLKSNKVLLMKKDENAGYLKSTAGSEMVQQADGATEQRMVKKFKFWCEMCQVGSFSSQVMEDHKRGKKHRANLLVYKSNNNNEAASKTTAVLAEAAAPKQEVPDVINEPNNIDEAALETTHISSEAIVPKPEVLDVLYELDKSNEAASETTRILLDAVIIPKQEDPNAACEPNKSDEAASKLTHVSSKAIISKLEDPDVENQAKVRTAIEDVANVDNRSLTPEAKIISVCGED